MERTGLITVPLECYPEVREVLDLPRGELLCVSLNPWNGLVVMSYQDNPNARFFARLVLDQLASYRDVFSADDREGDAPCLSCIG